jgi:hypothetical protein
LLLYGWLEAGLSKVDLLWIDCSWHRRHCADKLPIQRSWLLVSHGHGLIAHTTQRNGMLWWHDHYGTHPTQQRTRGLTVIRHGTRTVAVSPTSPMSTGAFILRLKWLSMGMISNLNVNVWLCRLETFWVTIQWKI